MPNFRQPDDFHLHVRQGAMLAKVLPYSSNIVGRATIMPNLAKPIINGTMANQYRQEILSISNKNTNYIGNDFQPLMTIYATENCDIAQLAEDYKAKKFFAIKYYPKGATTLSEQGVEGVKKLKPLLDMMAMLRIPLLLHGEATGFEHDIFDKEKIFIEQELTWLLEKFPNLKIVLEHITSRYAVDFLQKAGNQLAATITCHHLLLNRNDIFHVKKKIGLNPQHYCLPLLKRESDRLALLELATSGFKRVFAGSDSAPHPLHAKISACGCAGIFSAPVLWVAYYLAFLQMGEPKYFEAFTSQHGAEFFGLSLNQRKIQLLEQEWQVPSALTLPDHNQLVPFLAGETLPFSLSLI